MVLVDTTIWSLALRRRQHDLRPAERFLLADWRSLVETGRAALVGPIRQEILAGIQNEAQFEEIRLRLSDFPHLRIAREDYDEAARGFNRCRAAGIVGTAIDMLLCAVAGRHGIPIFTTDRDFGRYANHWPIRLHQPMPRNR